MGVFDRFSGDGFAILMPDRLPGLLLEPPEFVSGPFVSSAYWLYGGYSALGHPHTVVSVAETEPKVESIVGVDDGTGSPHDEKETEPSFVRTDVQPSPRTKVLLPREGGDSRGAGSGPMFEEPTKLLTNNDHRLSLCCHGNSNWYGYGIKKKKTQHRRT